MNSSRRKRADLFIVCCRSATDVLADLQIVYRSTTDHLQIVCRMSAEYLQNVCRISAECLQNICRTSAEVLQICRCSADEGIWHIQLADKKQMIFTNQTSFILKLRPTSLYKIITEVYPLQGKQSLLVQLV